VNKLSLVLTAVALILVGVGCSVPRSPIPGALYTDVKDGLMANSGPVGTKEGSAMATSIFGITTGDCSIKAAMTAGAINDISYVDYHSWGILGVYSTTTTTVVGK
jgi:hypothetical protein